MMENNEGGEVTTHTTNISPIRRVMKKDEEKSFQDLGLGRGVDATNPTPWLNKRPLQIREVTYGDIIGTEEGNLYQGFVNEVESTQHFQTNLSASVPVNQLVNLGIDSELSRSYSVSQKSVGRKITTRTISFRANFDKLSKESDTQGGANSTQGQSQTGRKAEPFEDRLTKWIKLQREEERVKKALQNQGQQTGVGQKQQTTPKTQNSEEGNQDQRRGEGKNGEAGPQETPRRQVGGETGMVTLDSVKISQEECFDLCYKFVSTFSVTHYVHSLELGASHYRVMSLEEYSTKFSSKAKLGVGQLADVAIGNEKSFNAKKYKSQTTKVGRMNMKLITDDDDSKHWGISLKKKKEEESDDKEEGGDPKKELEEEVPRSTIGEAVVGVKLQPISSLVFGNVGLRIALQKALQQYIHNRQKVKFGPFYIACNWDQLYLTVDKCKDHQVEATYNIDKASKFYIIRCDEGDNHFYIVHESPLAFKRDKDRKKFEAKVGEVEHKPAIPMYLCASVNWRGKSKRNQPLRMRLDGKSTNSRMAIHCRKNRHYHPADLTEWVNEKEIFFINCQERSITTPTSSYLCVHESGETGCMPTIESHDDKRKFMLFRLIKPREKAKEISIPKAPVDNLTKGPFLIKHQHFNEDFYIKIGKENKVELTDAGQIHDAHRFYIKRVSEYSNYFEIVSRDDKKMHITATVDWRGYGIHPPKLRSDENGRSFMAIYDRRSKPKDMKLEDPSKCGEDDDDAFFISCYTKPAFSKDASYLIVNQKVKWPWSDDTHHFWIGCAPNIKHNSRNGEPMLFKLVKDGEEQEATPPRQVQDDGGADQESDAGSVHIEVTAEMHS